MLAGLFSSTSRAVSPLGTQFRLSPHDARKEKADISRSISVPPHSRHVTALSADQL